MFNKLEKNLTILKYLPTESNWFVVTNNKGFLYKIAYSKLKLEWVTTKEEDDTLLRVVPVSIVKINGSQLILNFSHFEKTLFVRIF